MVSELKNTTVVKVPNIIPVLSSGALRTGEYAQVIGFTNQEIASKLLAIGVLPGSRIQIIRKAPFGGAIYVGIDQHFLALRPKELAAIAVRK